MQYFYFNQRNETLQAMSLEEAIRLIDAQHENSGKVCRWVKVQTDPRGKTDGWFVECSCGCGASIVKRAAKVERGGILVHPAVYRGCGAAHARIEGGMVVEAKYLESVNRPYAEDENTEYIEEDAPDGWVRGMMSGCYFHPEGEA